jgi:NAD(P)-dependent dehydrogenase (short-subunit alcohol dehydrogenase family)
MKLDGKVAVVTGASRGIGKGIARELGRAGATVVVTGRSVEPGHRLGGTIGETARLIDELGRTGLFCLQVETNQQVVGVRAIRHVDRVVDRRCRVDAIPDAPVVVACRDCPGEQR